MELKDLKTFVRDDEGSDFFLLQNRKKFSATLVEAQLETNQNDHIELFSLRFGNF